MPLFKSQPLICLVFCETNECVKYTMHRLIFTVKLYLTKPSNTLGFVESTTTTICIVILSQVHSSINLDVVPMFLIFFFCSKSVLSLLKVFLL